MVKQLAACVVVALAIAGCSGGSGGNKASSANGGSNKACGLIASLDQTTASITKLDVSDPDAYKQGLDDAVSKYAATVRELKPEVPDKVAPDLDRLEAAVHQYRFADAAAAKQSLDAYAADKCGRVATPSTVEAPSTSTPSSTDTSSTDATSTTLTPS